jgi:hypothetical protein
MDAVERKIAKLEKSEIERPLRYVNLQVVYVETYFDENGARAERKVPNAGFEYGPRWEPSSNGDVIRVGWPIPVAKPDPPDHDVIGPTNVPE